MNKINWNILKEMLDKELEIQKGNEMMDILAKAPTNRLEIEFKNLDEDYNFYKEKLDLITNLSKLNSVTQNKVIEIIEKMNTLDNISEKQKLIMKLSYIVLNHEFEIEKYGITRTTRRINDKTDEEIFMLSASSCGLDREDIRDYIGILSDDRVSRAIIEKSSDLSEQTRITDKIMDSQDQLNIHVITTDNYNLLVDNALKITNNYDIDNYKTYSK